MQGTCLRSAALADLRPLHFHHPCFHIRVSLSSARSARPSTRRRCLGAAALGCLWSDRQSHMNLCVREWGWQQWCMEAIARTGFPQFHLENLSNVWKAAHLWLAPCWNGQALTLMTTAVQGSVALAQRRRPGQRKHCASGLRTPQAFENSTLLPRASWESDSRRPPPPWDSMSWRTESEKCCISAAKRTSRTNRRPARVDLKVRRQPASRK